MSLSSLRNCDGPTKFSSLSESVTERSAICYVSAWTVFTERLFGFGTRAYLLPTFTILYIFVTVFRCYFCNGGGDEDIYAEFDYNNYDAAFTDLNRRD